MTSRHNVVCILIVVLIILLKTELSTAQSLYTVNKPEEKIAVAKLHADLSYLKNLLEKVHPSLYRYASKDSVDYWFNETERRITYPMAEPEFWRLLQGVIVKIGSGHTSLSASDAQSRLFSSVPHLLIPFYIYVRNDRMFVRNYMSITNGIIDIGDEILSIDGVPAKSILFSLRSLISGDGYSNSFKNSELESSNFQACFNIIYGEKPDHTIQFKEDDMIKTKVISSGKMVLRSPEPAPDKAPTNSYNLINAAVKPDSVYRKIIFPTDLKSTAFLKINEFRYIDYHSFHSDVFKKLKHDKIRNLVIDLRNCAGGQASVSIDLMRFLVNKESCFFKVEEMATDIVKFQQLLQLNQGADLTGIDHAPHQKKYEPNEYEKPFGNAFEGKLYILINGGTYSAGALLAVALKNQTDCTLIGEETGGGCAGTDGGDRCIVELPETRIKLHLPLKWGHSMTTEPDTGYGQMPDILCIPNKQDMIDLAQKKKDPFAQKLRELINSK